MKLRLLLSGIAAAVIYFLLGWLFYGMLFAEFFMNNAGSATGVFKGEDEMNLLVIFIGDLAWGFLLTTILGCWFKVKSIGDAAMKGLVLGLLMTAGFDLIMFGTSNLMNMTSTLVDILLGGVMSGIAGLVVGLIVKKETAVSE